MHAFIDESQRRATYLLACAQVPDADLADVRRTLRACLLPGQRRLHFVDERDQRRRQLLAEFAQQPIEFLVVAVPLGSRREAEARRLALQAIIGRMPMTPTASSSRAARVATSKTVEPSPPA